MTELPQMSISLCDPEHVVAIANAVRDVGARPTATFMAGHREPDDELNTAILPEECSRSRDRTPRWGETRIGSWRIPILH